ncbi:nuclear matrix constituent-like protein 1 [Striga asiatica]|uniref:Nuclear matrix constituent-like protein 1 n=1 Tax=Striga asiatica TaxID=4170 RepID=A0A5A7QCS0_STRAF|nr:nuclear matrix constituent-like protein 1 [Striga asiatica]
MRSEKGIKGSWQFTVFFCTLLCPKTTGPLSFRCWPCWVLRSRREMFSPPRMLWWKSPRSEPGLKNGTVSGPGSDSGLGLKTSAASPRNGGALAEGKAAVFVGDDGVVDQETLTAGLRSSKMRSSHLFDYQYKMGLLLVEKNEWNMKHEGVTQALADASDTLKKERAAHSSAMLEMEKREENLKKALGVEKQCVLDVRFALPESLALILNQIDGYLGLEKALREMRSEHAEIKLNANSKLDEANALITSVEQKSLEVEAKFHAADAKLAEVSRKSSEIDRKLHELETQENVLRRERSLFATEREAHEASMSKQREDLRQWEQKLKETEERLADELQKKIEITNSDLRNKEEDISKRLASLACKEKASIYHLNRLEEREKQLLELEENLNTREKCVQSEIQKQLDEHQSILTKKQKEFELMMEKKRKSNDEQLKEKMAEVEKKEAELTHVEVKVKKREQAVEKKIEKVRDKETDIDSKSKTLKEREKSHKLERINLEKEKKLMLAEKQDLLSLKAELENLKAHGESQLEKLNEEREQLKITEDERSEFTRLQSELKEEINKYRFQKKEKFEKEWEELDNKRTQIKKEEENVLEQKRLLEKLRLSEEEKLNNEKLKKQQYVQRELEALKFAQGSFAARMEHEKALLAEKAQSERTQLIHDLEVRKQELEAEFRRKQEELESSLKERKQLFEQEKGKELEDVNYLREVARREMEEMKLERLRMEKEHTEISENKKRIESQQLGMKKDTEELVSLSLKLKDQREQLIKERERFVSFSEKQKNCNICGETIREFMLSDLHPLPKVAEDYLKEAERLNAESLSPALAKSGSSPAAGKKTMSWLSKCTTKILIFSPGRRLDLDYCSQNPEVGTLVKQDDVTNSSNASPSGEKEPELLSLRVANDSYDVQIVESETAIGEFGAAAQAPPVDQDPPSKPEYSKTNGNVETSVQTNDDRAESDLGGAPKNTRKRNRSQATASDNQIVEGHSDSIKDGDRPRRRRRVVAAEHGQRRYNLRTNKKSVGTVANGSLPKAWRKGKEKESDQPLSENLEASAIGASRKEIEEHDSRRIGAEDADDHHPLRSAATASEFSADSPSEEVNGGSAECAMEEYSGEDYKTASREEDDDDENDGDGDEVDHPGEISVGKKLWTFITT